MKKLFLIFLLTVLIVFNGCKAEEIPEKQEEPVSAEKIVITVGGKDYEVLIPEKTRINDHTEGNIEILTSSLTEPGTVIDFSGLSGCEYIRSLVIKLNGEKEKLILPHLPNLSYCEIYGNAPELIDASAMKDYTTLNLSEVIPEKIDIGSGPESLVLGYGFDLSKISGAENVKNVTVFGNADLSKIAGIGEVEEVFILGENNNVADLENLKSLKKLSFQAFTGDLSGIGNLSMEILVFNDGVTQEILDTLTKSETVTDLFINDEFLTNSDFMDKLPNLRELVLTVDPIQPEKVPIRGEITDVSQIDTIMTNIPKEKLKAFFENGGTIFIMDDWSRT